MLTRGKVITIEFEMRIFLVGRSAPNKPGEPAPPEPYAHHHDCRDAISSMMA
jgi:hypothetical protein